MVATPGASPSSFEVSFSSSGDMIGVAASIIEHWMGPWALGSIDPGTTMEGGLDSESFAHCARAHCMAPYRASPDQVRLQNRGSGEVGNERTRL